MTPSPTTGGTLYSEGELAEVWARLEPPRFVPALTNVFAPTMRRGFAVQIDTAHPAGPLGTLEKAVRTLIDTIERHCRGPGFVYVIGKPSLDTVDGVPWQYVKVRIVEPS